MRAACVALGRRAGLRRALALRHVLMLAAHVLHLLLHHLLHLAVHLPPGLALVALTLVLHPAVTLAVRSRGLRVLADGCAMVVTLSLSQRPSTGEHRGRRDTADQQNLRPHVCLQSPATGNPLLVRIGAAGFHRSFSGKKNFVTKCVRRGSRNTLTYIKESTLPGLLYTAAMASPSHILVVDDHREIRELVSRALAKDGFRVSTAADGKAMRKVLADSRVDLVLLDLMLPGEDGLTLCRALRAESNIPVIMLTAKGDEVDRVIGLEMGADDYLPKPFGSRELIARIKAVLRRTQETAAARREPRAKRYRFDRWGLDTGARELLRDDGVTVPLSTGEYDLLITLVERPQRMLSRDQLLDLTRGRTANALDRSVDTQVSRLRKKLERDPADPKIIKTVWGGGYMFTPAVKHE
jgi:two-component system OmpR family response regulator